MYLKNLFSNVELKSCGLLLPLILLLFNCTQPPKGNESIIGEPQESRTDLSEATTYTLDTRASVITWIGNSPARQHNGTIDITSGEIFVQDTTILGGEIVIDILSLDIKDLKEGSDDYQKLKAHLMSEDFFLADTFPRATFEVITLVPFDSTIKIVDNPQFESENTPALLSEFMMKNPTHYLTGNLTIRGITKGITFPATIQFRNDKILAEAKFNIDRTEWNISYQDESSVIDKATDRFIYNTVNVGFSFQAIKKQ